MNDANSKLISYVDCHDSLGQYIIGQMVYHQFIITNSKLIKYHSFFDTFEPVFGHKNRMVIRTTQELIMKEVLKKSANLFITNIKLWNSCKTGCQ